MLSNLFEIPALPWRRNKRTMWRNQLATEIRLILATLLVIALASCNSLGKPEQQRSNLAPSCNQREPALDSGDPPTEVHATDWMAWAQAYVRAQWAVVDRDNKRAATADCLDEIARIKP